MSHTRSSFLHLLAAALLLASLAAAAPAPQDLLPADTVFVISLPDIDRSVEQFRQTAAYNMWMEPDIQQLVKDPIQAAKAAIQMKLDEAKAQMSAHTNLSIDDFVGVFGKQVTFAVLKLGLEHTPAKPEIALMLGIRDQAKYTATCDKLDAAMIQAAQEKNEGLVRDEATMSGVPVVVWSGDTGHSLCRANVKDLCVLTIGTEAMDTILKALTGSTNRMALSGAHSMTALHQRLGTSQADYLMYLNLARVLEALAPRTPPEATRALEVLGVSDLMSVAMGLAITPPGIKDAMYLHLPAERRGIFNMVQPGNVSPDLLKLVPANAQNARIGRFSLLNMWQEINQVWATLHPQTHLKFQTALQDMEQQLQLSIEKDLFASLGESFVASAVSSGMPGLGAVGGASLLWEVRDQARLELALNRAIDVAMQAAAAKRAPNTPGPQWREMAHGENTIHYLTLPMPIVSPAYAVTPEYLVFGLQPMGVKQAINRLSTDEPDIRTKPDFQQTVSHITQPNVMMGYADLKNGFLQTYMMLPMLIGMAQAKGVKIPIDVAALPPAQSITKHLFGATGALTYDDEGLCAEYYSPFGGLTLGTGIGAAVAGGVAGFRVQKARTQAKKRAARELREELEEAAQ